MDQEKQTQDPVVVKEAAPVVDNAEKPKRKRNPKPKKDGAEAPADAENKSPAADKPTQQYRKKGEADVEGA